ncbi:MAG: bifunctional glutamate N-acetyltransferase/amino-acid acetyltransferase ArgJ [Clostridia bacterium]|nr:bifunctional glutamate N-acetyltransferase/amino-acid acetyltransferase ArgJ [Clostridia bacterium]
MEISIDDFKTIEGGVTAPSGFKASGVASGIKKNGGEDIALILSDCKASAAGVFTLNKVRGHSLELSVENLCDGMAQCVFINSGNANACLGPKGKEDAMAISKKCASLAGISPKDVLTGSTGVIGHPLPMEKVLNGISDAYYKLDKNGGINAARAIMTTDTYPKEAAVSYSSGGRTVTIGGMAKGSGMIHPNMATMISVITTDASISPELLIRMLRKVADKSFNRISIDGETSVCDKILVLANGMSGISDIKGNSYEALKFEKALEIVSIRLAKMLASDGEGATKLIEINIRNAATPEDAHSAGKAIANSPLVKTAFFGEDANWGRILTAVGYSGAEFNPSETSISIGPMVLFDKGVAIPFDEDQAKEVLSKHDISVEVNLGSGTFDTTIWTCDFSREYIDINANYRT